MTYQTKCKADGSCVERIDSQAESIKAYQDEINRLRTIVEKKTEAMDRAVKQITNCRKSRQRLFNENSGLKERIRKLERRQPVVLREDANWDSRPREESWEL
ncbi:hypothetical protein [Salinicoccus carnicancri]|uniref:hypothetical protein n=1 Tax=Salinicoccus carnicancri TaxID=558170 RepID=UPI0003177B87|nr:hypothetical protein [Salinicoccus carnicancri]